MPVVVLKQQRFVPAASVYHWQRQILSTSGPILDFGAGNLRNAIFLQQQGGSIWAVDLQEQVEKIKHTAATEGLTFIGSLEQLFHRPMMFGAVICTYVLNIVVPAQRRQMLTQLANSLMNHGLLCVEVRKIRPGQVRNCLSSEQLQRGCQDLELQLIDSLEGKTWFAHLYQKQ